MSWSRIKRSLADDLFSKYIRARDNYTCQRCHRYFENGIGLDNSHYWGRGNQTTRYDPDNCDALCRGCHEYAGSGDGRDDWYTPFKKKQLGEQRYNALMVRAHQTGKKDETLARLYVRGLIRELEQERGIKLL